MKSGRSSIRVLATRKGQRVAKRRRRLSKRVRTLITSKSGGKCCICQRRGDQFHHLDSDPSNGHEDNIVLLCVKHHEEASRTSSMSIKLDAATLQVARERLYEQVTVENAVHRADPLLRRRGKLDFHRMVEAAQVARARELVVELDTDDWGITDRILRRFHRLANEDGEHIRSEALAAVEELTPWVRQGMPLATVGALAEVTGRACIHGNIFSRRTRAVSAAERLLLLRGSSCMFSLIHDGAKYRGDLRIVARGAEVLGWILRFSRVNGLRDVERDAMEQFERA